MTFPTAQQANTVGGGGTSTSPFITHFANRDPLPTDLNFPITKRWVNTVTINEFILIGYLPSNGVVYANWQTLNALDQLTIIQYDVLVGGPNNTIVSVGPGSLGQVFISAGPAAYPGYSTIFTVTDSTSMAALSGVLTITKTANAGGQPLALQNLSSVVGATCRVPMAVSANGATSDCYFLMTAGSGSGQSWEHGVVGSSKNYEFQSGPANTHTYMDGTTRLSISQAGVIAFNQAYSFPTSDGASGEVLTTNGAGTLSFQSVASASTAWTPTIQFGGLSTGITYSTNAGKYEKVGNIIFYYFLITLTSKGSAVGNATVSGFPFAPASIVNTTGVSYSQNLSYPAGYTTVTINPLPGQIYANLTASAPTGSPLLSLTDVQFTNNTTLATNGFYWI